jgi:hypothetical protein
MNNDQPAAKVAEIAKEVLDIPTLEPRGRDGLDFHEVGVMGLRRALLAAFTAGQLHEINARKG